MESRGLACFHLLWQVEDLRAGKLAPEEPLFRDPYPSSTSSSSSSSYSASSTSGIMAQPEAEGNDLVKSGPTSPDQCNNPATALIKEEGPGEPTLEHSQSQGVGLSVPSSKSFIR